MARQIVAVLFSMIATMVAAAGLIWAVVAIDGLLAKHYPGSRGDFGMVFGLAGIWLLYPFGLYLDWIDGAAGWIAKKQAGGSMPAGKD